MESIVVRGAGDLATGTIIRLSRAGYRVIALECPRPTAIRREASFCEAVYTGGKTVEGMCCRRVGSPEEAAALSRPGEPVLLVDERAESVAALRPDVLIDAIIAKKNLGTRIDMAPLTIALGPGFRAGVDVDYVIETMRGHSMGRILAEGEAMPNTGVPGLIAAKGRERVIHAPEAGILRNRSSIGDIVEEGSLVAEIQAEGGRTVPVKATLTGVLRGILPDGFPVWAGLKMADIDPRADEQGNCRTVSDKSRAIAGSVLELVCAWEHGCLGERGRRT